VADLFVREAARSRKVGSALMDEAARIIRRQGGRRILWTVWSRNPAAIDFYWSLGARFVEDEPLMTWTSESWPTQPG
jgi:ribosomal protein S18 acetylase RimI-like enzyme